MCCWPRALCRCVLGYSATTPCPTIPWRCGCRSRNQAGAPAEDRELPIAGQIRIPVQLVDPIEILTNLHTATERMNTAHSHDDEMEHFTGNAAAITSLIPSSVLRAGMRIVKQLDVRQRLTPISHGSVSSDSGQSSPAYCAGAKVVGMHTVTPLLEGCGLTITPTTHGEQMHLSVCVCPDNVPGVDDIATGIVDALEPWWQPHAIPLADKAARSSPR